MADLINFDKVSNHLSKLSAEVDKPASVIVGYTQSYAVHVHENLQAVHPVGQAKYLEQPARMYANEIAAIVRQAYQRGVRLGLALVMGGLRLQRESQKLVPVDTAALKGSAFTATQDNLEAESMAAYRRGEAIREQELANRKKASN